MSAVRMDPRVNVDRVYQYGEYQALRARHGRYKKLSFIQRLARISGLRTDPPRAIRLLPYKVAFVSGLAVLLASLTVYAGMTADTTRLQYEEQRLKADLARLSQAKTEAIEANAGQQMKVLQDAGQRASDVTYPVQTEYIVITNIPQAAGKRLVEDLYPLSKRLIQVQP